MSEDKGVVRLAIEGAIARITFDRPQARNAMTWTMYQQLGDICEQLRANPDVRCAVLRGAGGEAFVAGTDIEQFREFASGDDGVAYEKRIDQGIAKIEALPMPTLAVIEGWCVGGGLAIATACDVRIGNASAKFGVPIARTLGNCLSITNVARLVAAWGKPRVQRMLIAAEVIDASEARACGYLMQVVEEEITAAIDKRAAALAALAPVTQAVSKEALRRLLVHELPVAEDLIRRAYATDDFREGVAAFTEKRAPRWRGV
jgi:enoyl-CoA hydratase/carnithine racemase